MLPPNLPIALKEWKLVEDALASGRQILLLRKGGISDLGGEFSVEHNSFVFFPTYVHQNLQMVKPDAREGFEARSAEPEKVAIVSAGEVTDILRIRDREQMDRLDAEHVWASPLIDMRFSYRPQSPLYLLLIRAYRLAIPIAVDNTPAYAGCKSWVPLESPVATAGAMPALTDEQYADRRHRILSAL